MTELVASPCIVDSCLARPAERAMSPIGLCLKKIETKVAGIHVRPAFVQQGRALGPLVKLENDVEYLLQRVNHLTPVDWTPVVGSLCSAIITE